MKIKKVEGTNGHMLFLNDDVHILFTSADIKDSRLVSYLYSENAASCFLFGDQSKQFGELWEAISTSGQTTSAD